MKMVITIVEDYLSQQVSGKLLAAKFRVTRLASTGGFLREGATTLMIGAEDDQVETVLSIIREQVPPAEDPQKPNATIFVLNVKGHRRV